MVNCFIVDDAISSLTGFDVDPASVHCLHIELGDSMDPACLLPSSANKGPWRQWKCF